MAHAQVVDTNGVRDDFSLLVDGELVGAAERLDVINPATGKVFAHCPAAGIAELGRAVAAARSAFPAWSARSFEDRTQFIKNMAAVLRANQDMLGELLTREQGKPLAQAKDEIGRAAAQSEGMTGIRIAGEIIADDAERRVELRYVPLGVAGIITPWNAPINLAAGPLTSALYTGNTVVLKPSPYTPLSTLKIAELIRDVFPRGVINVLAGGDALGQWMTEHPGIDKISFTGSVATGKKVMASAAGTLKRITLELGGNDAAIVLDDVDPKVVAAKLFFAGFVNSGQVCMAIKRIYAHEKIYAALCEALVDEARKWTVGDGLDPATKLGPMQNRMQYDKVVDIIEDTRRSGARFLAGGETSKTPGYFINPALVADVDEKSRLVREEQFGPIVPVLKFTDVEDALRRANDTRYGLSGSVWSRDPERAAAIAARLEVGTAWVNQHRATAANIPFGGAKESGMGRVYSEMGLKAYMEPRVISVLKQPM
ncbi:MAG TPA: aldehyde dehydrogenase family protein [Steroidobacteraceae bacterium]|nr:aldehyde dehydrogenase family protein [Steroidobacteraceae bacterium]